jgi:hypothetical protein
MLHPQENAEKYMQVVSDEFFDCISSESNVLEIGPFGGWFSDVILSKNPKNLFLVEPSLDATNQLLKKFQGQNNIQIINKDIFDCIEFFVDKQIDVVVIFGVLYHLASPFDVLEKIANYIKPNFICLDNCSGNSQDILINDKQVNQPGNRQSKLRTVGLSLTIPDKVLKVALKNLGYNTIHHRYMKEFDVQTKQATHIVKFQHDLQ